jgi:hypothetical protein
MANSNGWGDGAANNAIGWGQGANNAIGWGKSHINSWSGLTDIDGGNAPVNSVAPALNGTAQEGQTLTCSIGTWSGSPTYTYQWKRNGSNIGSATNSTYTIVTADIGQSILCTVTATNFIGSATADSNTVTPISAFTGILDTYSGSAVAYSLRKLRAAYTGNLIRVRRSSDNAEQDIGYNSNNDLDTASLLTFCGAGNGFVTTWYDQSGNINHSTQATAVNQAQIVSSGALILDSVTNKITTTWSNDRYNLTSGISTNTRYLSVSMWNRISTIHDMIALGNTSTIVTPVHWRSSSVANAIASIMNTSFIHDNIATTGRCVITSLKNASNLRIMYRNGVQLTSTTTDAPASDTLNCFGQSQSYIFTSGQCQEYIYWNSEQSANRTGIENNIKTYWNAY